MTGKLNHKGSEKKASKTNNTTLTLRLPFLITTKFMEGYALQV